MYLYDVCILFLCGAKSHCCMLHSAFACDISDVLVLESVPHSKRIVGKHYAYHMDVIYMYINARMCVRIRFFSLFWYVND